MKINEHKQIFISELEEIDEEWITKKMLDCNYSFEAKEPII